MFHCRSVLTLSYFGSDLVVQYKKEEWGGTVKYVDNMPKVITIQKSDQKVQGHQSSRTGIAEVQMLNDIEQEEAKMQALLKDHIEATNKGKFKAAHQARLRL